MRLDAQQKPDRWVSRQGSAYDLRDQTGLADAGWTNNELTGTGRPNRAQGILLRLVKLAKIVVLNKRVV